MSILYQNEKGWLISHKNYIDNIYSNVNYKNEIRNYKLKKSLFEINSMYLRSNQNNETNLNSFSSIDDKQKDIYKSKKRKKVNVNVHEEFSEEINFVQATYLRFLTEAVSKGLIINSKNEFNNNDALKNAEICYQISANHKVENISGGNNSDSTTVQIINSTEYIFPSNCEFHCKDIKHMNEWVKSYKYSQNFDLIILDPPWCNKYIKRKKKKCVEHSYSMLDNNDIKNLPIGDIISATGLVVIWCTNSFKHVDFIINDLFPSWNINFIARWYWLKITKNGQTVCNFSPPPGKQPFEQILIGSRRINKEHLPPDKKLIISVPSALHSHKPPLIDVLKPYIATAESPKCLEIFARYLLPGWTSWGLEVCRFQHISLYTHIDEEVQDNKSCISE